MISWDDNISHIEQHCTAATTVTRQKAEHFIGVWIAWVKTQTTEERHDEERRVSQFRNLLYLILSLPLETSPGLETERLIKMLYVYHLKTESSFPPEQNFTGLFMPTIKAYLAYTAHNHI